MTLRLSFILILISFGNSLYPRDPHYLSFETNAKSDGRIDFGHSRTLESYYSLQTTQTLSLCLLLKDTIPVSVKNDPYNEQASNGNKWLKAAIIPAGLITLGIITSAVPSNTLFSKYTIQEKIRNKYPDFSTKADNYLQYVPGVAVFGLKALGVKSRSDFLNQSIILAKAELLTGAIVYSLKSITHVERPNGDGYQSMPSGHTAQAFLLATILDMEYRDASPWISVSGYAVASATGALRMLNNKHWISDVLVGAGIGIFTTKFVYLTHQYRWGKNSNYVLLPAIYKNGGGIYFAMQL
jgi:hypothetical protein